MPATPEPPASDVAPVVSVATSAPGTTDSQLNGRGTWIVLPTYNEADNIGPITSAILARAACRDPPRGRRRLA